MVTNGIRREDTPRIDVHCVAVYALDNRVECSVNVVDIIVIDRERVVDTVAPRRCNLVRPVCYWSCRTLCGNVLPQVPSCALA